MSRMFPLLLVAAGATALSACAPMTGSKPAQTASSGRQCFFTEEVDNFRGDNQTLHIRTRNKDVYELQSLGYCADIDFAFSIAFVPGGLRSLCTGDFSRIVVSGGPAPRNQCRVQVVKKLTEAEVMALPARDRP